MAAGRKVTRSRNVGRVSQGMRPPDQEGSGCWQNPILWKKLQSTHHRAARAAAPGAGGARLSARSNTTAFTGHLQVTMTNTTRRQDLAALPSGCLALSGLFPG